MASLAVAVSACAYLTGATPPHLAPPLSEEVRYDGATAHVGPSYLSRRGKLWVMQVRGSPAQLGYRHARLTKALEAEGDRRLGALFATYVPSALFRWTLNAVARFRYRNLGDEFPSIRQAEIFGQAGGYADHPAGLAPVYDRLVFLHGLYDIALSFERSPLLGCTAFAASGRATRDGATPRHMIVGRNFDLDLDSWFDTDKLVQIVEPENGIAFVSVSWPGMTGVVTGMNTAGIWISVNGGRASDPRTEGVPVVFTTRAVLEGARSLDDALAIIARDEAMVSHILLVADGKAGESMIVERAPGRPLGVVREPSSIVLANHFRTSPLRDDVKNERIRDITSTVARQARMEELVTRHSGRIDPRVATAILRDRAGVGGTPLPLGNRAATDPFIATHSVLADLTARVLWVSEGPHTLGSYRAIDLGARLELGEAAAAGEAAADLPADPILTDGTFERYGQGALLRSAAAAHARDGKLAESADLYRRAIALRDDDNAAWRGLALAEERLFHHEAARAAWSHVLALAPESPAARREAEERARGH